MLTHADFMLKQEEIDMPTMTISLHDEMKKHISSQGTSAGAYIRMLILQDMISTMSQERKARIEAACMYMSRTDLEKTKLAFSDLFNVTNNATVQFEKFQSADNIENLEVPSETETAVAATGGVATAEIKKKKERPVLPAVQH